MDGSVPLSALMGILGLFFDKKKWLAGIVGGISTLLTLAYICIIVAAMTAI